jgi:hypothetical protein
MTDEDETAEVVGFSALLLPHVAILVFVSDRDRQNIRVTRNGSVSFIDTGRECLLVTCDHVIREFQELRQDDPSLRMAIGGGGTEGLLELLDEYVVDRDDYADLATLRLPDPYAIQSFGKAYFRSAVSWPPAHPAVREEVVALGFQGENRIQIAKGLRARTTLFKCPVSSVAEKHFLFVDEEETRRVVKIDQELGELGGLGGMSGSGAFAFNKDGLTRVVGFFYESLPAFGIETHRVPMYFTHAAFISEEGTIDRSYKLHGSKTH